MDLGNFSLFLFAHNLKNYEYDMIEDQEKFYFLLKAVSIAFGVIFLFQPIKLSKFPPKNL